MSRYYDYNEDYLDHSGTLGMKWGQRLYQYKDGSLTPLGRIRYGVGKRETISSEDAIKRHKKRKAVEKAKKTKKANEKAAKQKAYEERKAAADAKQDESEQAVKDQQKVSEEEYKNAEKKKKMDKGLYSERGREAYANIDNMSDAELNSMVNRLKNEAEIRKYALSEIEQQKRANPSGYDKAMKFLNNAAQMSKPLAVIAQNVGNAAITYQNFQNVVNKGKQENQQNQQQNQQQQNNQKQPQQNQQQNQQQQNNQKQPQQNQQQQNNQKQPQQKQQQQNNQKQPQQKQKSGTTNNNFSFLNFGGGNGQKQKDNQQQNNQKQKNQQQNQQQQNNQNQKQKQQPREESQEQLRREYDAQQKAGQERVDRERQARQQQQKPRTINPLDIDSTENRAAVKAYDPQARKGIVNRLLSKGSNMKNLNNYSNYSTMNSYNNANYSNRNSNNDKAKGSFTKNEFGGTAASIVGERNSRTPVNSISWNTIAKNTTAVYKSANGVKSTVKDIAKENNMSESQYASLVLGDLIKEITS